MKSFKNQEGFTLVELMVVVAIIGILSAVAIPNFKRYQAKSKTSEAKLQLSAIYQAQTTLMSDYDNYGSCLAYAGYSSPTNNYYITGFNAANATANGRIRTNAGPGAAAAVCLDADQFQFGASKQVGGAAAAGFGQMLGTSVVQDNGQTFIAEAYGYIDSDFNTGANGSRFTINENKQVVNLQLGY